MNHRSGDVDKSLTLEYPEFCGLLKLEKKVFTELTLAESVKEYLRLEEAIKVLQLVN